ncbi:MAG: toll/interleukin-1 receptor domain-containing protein [Vicinamibacterales bacterium]
MADVFISHSSQDATAAALVCRRLEAAGIRCWIAPRDVPSAGDYAKAIMEGLSGTRLLLLLLSEGSNKSAQVRREVEQASGLGIPLLPARLDPVDASPALRFFVAAAQWIDLFPDLNGRIPVLADVITRLLAGKNTRPDTPGVPWHGTIRTFVSWAVVAAVAILWLVLLQQRLTPLLPLRAVHLLIAASPALTLLPVAAIVLGAIALNYQAERRRRGLWRLRALFTTSSNAGRSRTAAAGVLLIGLAIATSAAPPVVSIGLEQSRLPPPGTDYDVVYANGGQILKRQEASHYEVSLNPGLLPLEGRYTLTIQLREYETDDGLEFGTVYFDRRLNRPALLGEAERADASGSYAITGNRAEFAGKRRILSTFAYYPRRTPHGNVISVSFTYEGYPAVVRTHDIDVQRWPDR